MRCGRRGRLRSSRRPRRRLRRSLRRPWSTDDGFLLQVRVIDWVSVSTAVVLATARPSDHILEARTPSWGRTSSSPTCGRSVTSGSGCFRGASRTRRSHRLCVLFTFFEVQSFTPMDPHTHARVRSPISRAPRSTTITSSTTATSNFASSRVLTTLRTNGLGCGPNNS